jgi:hypothetical protein
MSSIHDSALDLSPGTKAQPDTQIGNYRIEKTIGQGTYGKVKLGVHCQTNEKVRDCISFQDHYHPCLGAIIF